MDVYLNQLYLTNARVLLWLNHHLAQNPDWYKTALLLTNKGTDVAVLLTLLWLWFWPEPKGQPMFDKAALPNRAANTTKFGSLLASLSSLSPARLFSRTSGRRAALHAGAPPSLTRIESRAQLLVFGTALMAGYITARLIGVEVNLLRPFLTYLPVQEGVPGAFDRLRSEGSFPSNHAVLLGGLMAAFFYWNKALGWAWAICSVVLMVIRAAVGYHYPLDMVAGAALGVIYVGAAMTLYRTRGWLHGMANMLSRSFELASYPYCYILYFLVALLGAEVFIEHLDHIMYLIFDLRGAFIARFK